MSAKAEHVFSVKLLTPYMQHASKWPGVVPIAEHHMRSIAGNALG